MRILVLWSRARGVTPGEDARWARAQTDALLPCHGVAAMALHPVANAAALHPQPASWCLELRLASDVEPHQVVRDGRFAEFLADLRLLGMRPSVLAIEDDG